MGDRNIEAEGAFALDPLKVGREVPDDAVPVFGCREQVP